MLWRFTASAGCDQRQIQRLYGRLHHDHRDLGGETQSDAVENLVFDPSARAARDSERVDQIARHGGEDGTKGQEGLGNSPFLHYTRGHYRPDHLGDDQRQVAHADFVADTAWAVWK